VAKVAPNVRNAKSIELAYQADLESIILLKNEKNTLPLDVSGKRIALIGPLLRDNALQDYQEVFGENVRLISEQALRLTDEHRKKPNAISLDDAGNKAGIRRAIEAAEKSDIVVMLLGGDAHTAREAYFNCCYGDRYSLEPVGLQDELLRQVKALGKPVIVVVKHRRTLAINEIADSADAVIDAWDLSEQGDKAIANIIKGTVNPSGKLPVTVPRHIGQIPFHYSQKHVNFKKDYLFIEEGPLYPFGYGLSYTDFEFSDITLSSRNIENGGTLIASVRVTNEGDRKGKEVVQLYIKDMIGLVLRPEKELKAFQKIELDPGESRDVSFEITPEMLAFTDINMEYRVEAGAFRVEIGNSSQGGKMAEFTVESSE
jgi:beta-glucosidase